VGLRSSEEQAPAFEIGFTQMDKPSKHFSEFPSVQVAFAVELQVAYSRV
jgi:hypothetical protein